MNTISATMERHYKPIIFSLLFLVLFFATSCTLHDAVPICHYAFGCDHLLHVIG